MLNLSKVLPNGLETEDSFFTFPQLRFLLELIDLLKKELAAHTSLFRVVTQMAQAILDFGGVLDDSLT